MTPSTVGVAKKKPGALGELRKQRARVARQPPRERTVTPAFQGMEQPQRDHLTGPEVGFGMFGDGGEMVINLTEEGRDKIDGGGHRLLRSWQGCTRATSVEEVYDHDNKASKYYCVNWFVRD